MQKTPVILLILDGFGHNENQHNNAVAMAKTPNLDLLKKNNAHGLINASESHVGLPEGQMGNSEVGHISIGSGRIVYQDIERINESIKDKSFFKNKLLNDNITRLKNTKGALHILGLISDGGVHSHIDHIAALLKLAKEKNINKVYIHAFLDGRDTPPKSAEKYLKSLEDLCSEREVGKIISLCGRFYAMDRDKRWERTEVAHNLVVNNQANYHASSTLEALHQGYERGENDEFISPTIIDTEEKIKIYDKDTIVFMNFRSDRARQLTDSILNDNFNEFQRSHKITNVSYLTLTNHDSSQHKALPIFMPIEIKNTLGEIISQRGKSQLRIAETEKYPHVTFFFNGGEETVYPGEERIMIPSPKVETYDLKPEMSAPELTKHLEESIHSGKYDLIICNYANGDMVGHTGNINAAIKAIETLDICIFKIAQAVDKQNGHLLITADHGNAEVMKDDKNNQPHTQHTTNLVPFIYVGEKANIRNGGNLADIAPTILHLMDEEIPIDMTGKNLIISND